jgi:hypothetical protein
MRERVVWKRFETEFLNREVPTQLQTAQDKGSELVLALQTTTDTQDVVGVCSDLSCPHIVQTGSGAHSASYPMGTGSSFHKGRGMVLNFHLQLVQRSRKFASIHPLPHTPSRRNAYLVKHTDKFTLPMSIH